MNDIKQLFKFYGIEYNPKDCYDLDIYIMNLEQLVDIQASQIVGLTD